MLCLSWQNSQIHEDNNNNNEMNSLIAFGPLHRASIYLIKLPINQFIVILRASEWLIYIIGWWKCAICWWHRCASYICAAETKPKQRHTRLRVCVYENSSESTLDARQLTKDKSKQKTETKMVAIVLNALDTRLSRSQGDDAINFEGSVFVGCTMQPGARERWRQALCLIPGATIG